VQVDYLPHTQVSSSQTTAHKEAAAAAIGSQQALQVIKVGATIPAVG
jgi:hypothetical protein